MALTNTVIQKAKPKEKPYKLTDGQGLYLYVSPKGGLSWRYDFRHGAKRFTLTIGSYPEVSLADARDRHRDARKQLATGLNPAEKKKQDAKEELAAEGRQIQNRRRGVARKVWPAQRN